MQIGTLKKLMRYPVKSMAGESLEEVFVAYSGLTGDRVFAFVNDEKAQAQDNFPWHTAREQQNLLLYKPRFLKNLDTGIQYPDAANFDVEVTTPSGAPLAIDDERLRQELAQTVAYPVKLRHSEKGMHDARPLSIFGQKTLDRLSEETGTALDPLRFRANFYVEWTDPTPFFEDSLVGKQLKIGDRLEIAIVKKDPRCVIITLDPKTGQPDPNVLRTVAKNHRGCAGVYAAVIREGIAKTGDIISLVTGSDR